MSNFSGRCVPKAAAFAKEGRRTPCAGEVRLVIELRGPVCRVLIGSEADRRSPRTAVACGALMR